MLKYRIGGVLLAMGGLLLGYLYFGGAPEKQGILRLAVLAYAAVTMWFGRAFLQEHHSTDSDLR